MTDISISLYPVNPLTLAVIPGSTELVLELFQVLRGPQGIQGEAYINLDGGAPGDTYNALINFDGGTP